MKKLYTLLISICLVAVLLCQSGMVLTLSADEVDSVNSGKTVSLTQLVRLKKYLAKISRKNISFRGISEFRGKSGIIEF